MTFHLVGRNASDEVNEAKCCGVNITTTRNLAQILLWWHISKGTRNGGPVIINIGCSHTKIDEVKLASIVKKNI
ncbi:MAG: hypothetical protein WC966_01290 [Bradymonadales bacterium]